MSPSQVRMAPTTLVVGAFTGCARNPSRRLLRLPSQIAMLNETLTPSEIRRGFSSEVVAKFVLFFLAERRSGERRSALVSPYQGGLTLMAPMLVELFQIAQDF
jgi:hypothetical protein